MFPFSSRKNDTEMRRQILRYINEQTRDAVICYEDHRDESRSNLNCGVLFVPLKSGEPDLATAQLGITKDLSSSGLAIMFDKPITATKAIVVLCGHNDALYVQVELRHCESIGLGFFVAGAQIVKLVTPQDFPVLGEIRDTLISCAAGACR
jgi:hypothetical protein